MRSILFIAALLLAGPALAQTTPPRVLRMATSTNAQLLQLCGKRNPYQAPVGVIEVGAHADMLLVNGDPIADINLLGDAEKNLLVIMKNGTFFKNKL